MAERPCFMLPLFCVCQAAVRYIIALAPWEERRRKAMSDQMIEKDYAVEEIRKECRQFAMLYFHFVKTMVKRFGKEEARELVRESVFSLAMERSSILKEKALELGMELTMDTFGKLSDIPAMAWDPCLGADHCPYGKQWKTYYKEYPWFKEFALYYCDIIDTSNCEIFTGDTSHRITKNVADGVSETCEREYFPSEEVRKGRYTYSTGSGC